jgi:NADH dehydrogenase [ubiquinone] 1 alpha subcomplex assembly factor 2
VSEGVDLKGNTFWELRDKRAAELGRVRRMVKTPRTTHYGEVVVSPAWHQWLRHTRDAPPSVDEQRTDVLRQDRMKVLAAEADARWAAKPGYLDGPEMAQPAPPLRSPRREDVTKPAGTLAEDVRETMNSGNRPDEEPGNSKKETWGVSQEEEKDKMRKGEAPETDPWKQADAGIPGQNWQPQGWNPSAPSKR